MKEVFSSSRVIPCDLIMSVLAAAGIEATLRNPLGSAVAGYGWPVPHNPSLGWAWPEVWVNDEDYAWALEVIARPDESL